MKFNQWTLGLAAVGAVSMASAVRADDAPKPSALNTALSNTTISGYISTSMNWEMTPSGNVANLGNSPAGNIPFQSAKANGFNLDVVKISIAKPEEATPYASGYEADLLFGPDAVGWNPSPHSSGTFGGATYGADFSIQQAFITLNTPVGNGIDWKFGVFNTVIGYESTDSGSNPNYTRSWGWAVEPTENTGVLASYKVNDEWSLSAGVANTLTAGINARNTYMPTTGSEWHKTVMGSVTFNAPSNWGWASGSALYAGIVYGFYNGATAGTGDQGGNQVNYYAGATLNSPWKNVTFGASLDYVQNVGGVITPIGDFTGHINNTVFGLYNTIKATDKLSFNTRGEYWEVDGFGGTGGHYQGGDGGIELTEDVEYDLWANVMTRLELRYDKCTSGVGNNSYVLPGSVTAIGGVNTGYSASVGLYANIIYKF